MEGGSPTLIWQRWTLPMYYAQQRYWGDHPRPNSLLRMLAAAKYRMGRQRKTPPRRRDAGPPIDMKLLNTPLTDAELHALKYPGAPIR